MVMFLFQMVFMDTAATIVTGAARSGGSLLPSPSRPSFSAAIIYPLYRQLGMGRRLDSPSSGPITDWVMAIATSPGRAWFTPSVA